MPINANLIPTTTGTGMCIAKIHGKENLRVLALQYPNTIFIRKVKSMIIATRISGCHSIFYIVLNLLRKTFPARLKSFGSIT